MNKILGLTIHQSENQSRRINKSTENKKKSLQYNNYFCTCNRNNRWTRNKIRFIISEFNEQENRAIVINREQFHGGPLRSLNLSQAILSMLMKLDCIIELCQNLYKSFKNENRKGAKQCKDCVTLVRCASMSGKKTEMLIIGESKKPRCFTNVKKILLTYYKLYVMRSSFITLKEYLQ